MRTILQKMLNTLENIYVYVAVASTFIMMCLTTADAAGRYIFNKPITGGEEFTEKYLMVAAVFFGLCYAYRGGAFIRVTFLVDRLPLKVKSMVNLFVQAFTALLGIMFFVATVKRAIQTFNEDVTLITIPLQMGPAYVFVPIGFFLLSVVLLIDLPRVRKGKSDLFKDEETNL